MGRDDAGEIIVGTVGTLFPVSYYKGVKGNQDHLMGYNGEFYCKNVIGILFLYCTMTGMQFVAIATILNLTIGLNVTLGIFIGWALLTLKTYFGGLKTVIWQDVIHGTILTLGVILLFLTVLIAAGGWDEISVYVSPVNQENRLRIMNIKPTACKSVV